MAGRIPKTTKQDWINAARRALIEDGVAGINLDRLAGRLKVSRGGLYHYFNDRDGLLDELLRHWEASCQFLPDDETAPTDAGAAVGWLDLITTRLIESDGYDPQFDLAVREWGRSDKRAGWAVARADTQRIAMLQAVFEALGYDVETADVRARVFYYHQIGYYAIGVRQRPIERRRTIKLYLDILCGGETLVAARQAATHAAVQHERRGKDAVAAL